MKKGIVYILTNPSMPDWVKIGYTDKDDMKDRLNSMNKLTEIPLSFRVYAILRTDDPQAVEQSIHKIMDSINPSIRALEKRLKGRDRVREFFLISAERAFSVLQEIAKIKNIKEELIIVTPSHDELLEEEIVRERRGRITFNQLKVPIGTELYFIKDDTVKCKTTNNRNTVEFKNDERTLSNLASELLGYNANGYRYFLFDGESLSDRRIRMDKEEI